MRTSHPPQTSSRTLSRTSPISSLPKLHLELRPELPRYSTTRLSWSRHQWRRSVAQASLPVILPCLRFSLRAIPRRPLHPLHAVRCPLPQSHLPNFVGSLVESPKSFPPSNSSPFPQFDVECSMFDVSPSSSTQNFIRSFVAISVKSRYVARFPLALSAFQRGDGSVSRYRRHCLPMAGGKS